MTEINPYTQWSVGAAVVLLMAATLLIGSLYVLWRAGLDKWRQYRSRTTAVVVAVLLSMTAPDITARQRRDERPAPGDSCWGQYQAFTLRAYEQLERCIVETNNDSAWRRLYVRSLCNANWISDSQQAMVQYGMCMTAGNLIDMIKR